MLLTRQISKRHLCIININACFTKSITQWIAVEKYRHFKKKYIFAPWNPTDHHWVLVVDDIQQQKIIYLDPFQMEVNNGYLKLLAAFVPQVLSRKFGFSGFQLESPPHTLQTDLKSSCVLVCWCAWMSSLYTVIPHHDGLKASSFSSINTQTRNRPLLF